MKELFEKIEIHSEADLPKEDNEYYVKKKDSFRLTTMIFKPNHPHYIKDWLFDYEVEWYLLPILQTESLPHVSISDEEIKKWIFNENPVKDRDSEWQYEFRQGLFSGAKAYRDGKIKPI
jgi:hypothetical protein